MSPFSSRVYLIITGGMVNLSRPRFNLQTSTIITAPEYVDGLHQITQPHDIALIGFNTELAFDGKFYKFPNKNYNKICI